MTRAKPYRVDSCFDHVALTSDEADRLDRIQASGEARPLIKPRRLPSTNDASQAICPKVKPAEVRP